MQFNIHKSIEILSRTPAVIEILLKGISSDWVNTNEGPETWSPYDVVGHLIHGEKTDWVPRMDLILSDKNNKTFKPFDRFAQFEESKGKGLEQLLHTFKELRQKNILLLQSRQITSSDLKKTGTHPALGPVTLEQLLATWVAHDLGHITQISRVMAKQYKEAVGPWRQYLPVLDR